jgi:pimeloyl-ACP methyl ester carboxylesterase
VDKLLPGITAGRVPTRRLTTHVLSVAGRSGPAVLFVHGNVSSALFWQSAMLALPANYRPLAIDLRGFGDTDPEPVDATRGVRDYSDDLAAVRRRRCQSGVRRAAGRPGSAGMLRRRTT